MTLEKADRWYSILIRLSYSDENGMCRCVTCGKRLHWKYMHNGHFHSRRFKSVRFDIKNCHPQCEECNCFKDGNIKAYEQYLIKRYGHKVIFELDYKRNELCKMNKEDYKVLVKNFKEMAHRMAKQKGLRI